MKYTRKRPIPTENGGYTFEIFNSEDNIWENYIEVEMRDDDVVNLNEIELIKENDKYPR